MNNENSMDWRQTQLTDRAAAAAFHSAECDTRSSGRFSTSLTRACPVPGGREGGKAGLLISSFYLPHMLLSTLPARPTPLLHLGLTPLIYLKGAPREIAQKKEESLQTPSSFMIEMEACGVRGNQLRDGRTFLTALITLILKSSLSLHMQLA